MTTGVTEASQRYSTYALVRRLLLDEALRHWPRYAVAFLLMGITAAATALTAYLLGTMTNEAYVNHNFHGIVVIGVIAIGIFAVKGFATYGSAVMLSWIGNSIIAGNQRRLFDKLLQQNIGFFADRHSSEFIARLTTGAAAVSQVISLLITAIGRDLMSLIGLTIVMVVQDPVMAMIGFVMAPPAFFVLRKLIRRVRNIAARRQRGCVRARVQQDGASLQPRQPADGNARRLCGRARHDLWRLSRYRDWRDAGRLRLVPRGISTRL